MMKETEAFEINEAVFDLLPNQRALILARADHPSPGRHPSNLVALVTDAPKRILFTLSDANSAPVLHVGEECELRIPDKEGEPEPHRATLRACVHASIPCGSCTVYLADVLEACFVS